MKWWEAYREYLGTDAWQELRAATFEAYGKRCQICSETKRLHVHHLLYRATFEESKPQDMMPLCEACHRMIHRAGHARLSRERLIELYRPRFVRKQGLSRPPKFIRPKPKIEPKRKNRKKRNPRAFYLRNARLGRPENW